MYAIESSFKLWSFFEPIFHSNFHCSRFKEVPYATDEDKSMVAAPIKEMLVKLIEEDEDVLEINKNADASPAKKSRVSGIHKKKKKKKSTPSVTHLLFILPYFDCIS